MKTALTLILLIASASVFGQSLLEAKLVSQWPPDGKKMVIAEKYNRISSYVVVLNPDGMIQLLTGENYTKDDREKIGLKKGEHPDYLSVGIRFKHPGLKTTSASDGNDPGIAVPLFSFDQRKTVKGINFETFDGMFLDDVKVSDITEDVMGKLELQALSSNNSEAFWLGLAKISGDFAQSAISLAAGNPAALGELKNKLTTHVSKGVETLNGLTAEPKAKNYTAWIKLLSRDANIDFEEVVSEVRLYQIQWSKLEAKKMDVFADIPFPAGTDKISTDILKSKVKALNAKEPLILVIEARSKTKINRNVPQLTKEYLDFAQTEHTNYSEKKQYTLFQQFFETFKLAYDASQQIDRFLANQGKEESKINLYEAINSAYKFRVNSNSQVQANAANKGDEDLRTIIEVIEKRYAQIRISLESKFGLTNNYALREANDIISTLVEPGQPTTAEDLEQAIRRMNAYEETAKATNRTEVKFSESYKAMVLIRNQLEPKVLALALKGVVSPDELFYEQLKQKYSYCNKCVDEALTKISQIRAETLASAKARMLSISEEYFKKFNTSRDSLVIQFEGLSKWINKQDEVVQAKLQPVFKKMTGSFEVWVDLVKKDNNQINTQTDIKVVSRWVEDLTLAMDTIILSSVTFSDYNCLKIPQDLRPWFASRSVELKKTKKV